MKKLSKRMQSIFSSYEKGKQYGLVDAVKLVKANAKAKFDETIEVAVNLNVDPRKADQNIRGVVQLPAGTGKKVRIAVFAKGDNVQKALNAGADIVGAEDLVASINSGNINFDKCIATPDMMGLVGPVARILGPRGLMPNPKLGTVTTDVAGAVAAISGGQIEYRNDKAGIVHAGVGKASFVDTDILSNVKAILGALSSSRPSATKGVFIKSVTLSSTMSGGVRINLSEI